MLKFNWDTPASVEIHDGSAWRADEGRVEIQDGTVTISAGSPVAGVRLFYETEFEKNARFFGDAWERAYGELEWRGMIAQRLMPWYMAVSEGGRQSFAGVKTGCGAFVGFRAFSRGLAVEIDTRSGAGPVDLSGRSLTACTLVLDCNREMSAYRFQREMLKKLCPQARLAQEPVYGGNNWYYAYGKSSREEILADSAFISRLAGPRKNRPWMVIDDGWQKHSRPRVCVGGPWVGNDRFGDMRTLAREMADQGVRPGIWIRPLLMSEEPNADWILQKTGDGWTLDPSNPQVLGYLSDLISELADQGYGLIKHDYTTFDVFGDWGCHATGKAMFPAHPMRDTTRTNAEIVLDMYKAIAHAAGEPLIIGCNTVSHLAAGLFQLQRTGDDTSGRFWERTRYMGVNTLAMRMPQHRIFYDCDADCAPITPELDWKLARRWLDVLSRSGTALFVSARPCALNPEQEAAVAEAFARAAENTRPAEPLDWQDTVSPRLWETADGVREYDFDALFDGNPEAWWY